MKYTYDQVKGVAQEEQGGDMQQIFSFLLAFAGTWMKQKVFIWMAFFFLLSSCATMKTRSANYMQIILNFGIIVMGFLSLYVWQPKHEMLLQQQREQTLQQN
ncbi:unnamed protein product [Paramecium primaurelia]|uniref:Uncharacterized protein n=1 Tax=Paramecium primaurelia TaxID=5886 RepID=A0A8S1Q536_PARPR|nr:unnamed protein product [Paramecium primaurelia]